ncbi:hypothetical protein QQS21_004854 [Conoideocrella luteorostrata]|uniref:Peptide hydrolase n=1 Tax=Conoideocrella luteorostrata TaxID=1105319 RepID=A0AAJ0FV35_9HYPO|nr:hypothetical protein QQS21_004854 [Conoideocrella luteorostrata]
MILGNPFAFRPAPVSFWTTVTYLAVFISLIFVHETVPSAPSQKEWPQGVNLTEAWTDLQAITRFYHPYNSHENDVVRSYLMRRSREILDRNGVKYTTDLTGGVPWESSYFSSMGVVDQNSAAVSSTPLGATIFDDLISNVTYAQRSSTVGQYFESSNFYVYIHGSEDPEGDWWTYEGAQRTTHRGAGVLVNCHFDSVSTGYGATDDGMSCISMLQLLSHFTSEGRQPKNGIVLLFNNAEEDGLLGAQAFGYSPLVQFCHAFVNLEGAGAGGRAMLFRTTDLETAQAYSKSPHPFGSVVAANAFERGVIRSGTDFSVFVDDFGQRGLDIAFFSPRSRYHTEDDDARHTSVDSIWHMLSAALASTVSLSETVSSPRFNGPRSDGRKDLVQNGRPTTGVWFDWYGSAWSAFPLRGLFAWTLTLLITTPLVLFLVTYLLVRKDKWYFFSTNIDSHLAGSEARISLGGWKGFIRLPIALAFAGGLTIGSVYLLAKVNPLIIYSSGYSVWAMMISLFYFVAWLMLRGADAVRPSALQRGFTLIWLFIITWVLSVFAAVAEDRLDLGGVYSLVFLHTFAFGAVLVSLLEQFALPRKQDYASQLAGTEYEEHEEADGNDAEVGAESANENNGDGGDVTTPTETTPLRAGEEGYGSNERTTTFASTYRRSVSEPTTTPVKGTSSRPPYEGEQGWSGRLPSWTWFIQFLLLGTVYVIVLGNLALVQTASMSMTGTDGSSLLAPLMGVGILTIMLLLPLTPFIHRVRHHVPIFLLVVFAATLTYNLVAFPFSVNNRFKFFFQQVIDINEGTNVVSLMGLEDFVRPVITSLPTPAGQTIECSRSAVRADVKTCRYDATLLVPDVANGTKLEDLVSIEASRASHGRSITVKIDAVNTRTCFLDTSSPIFGFSVEGGGKRDPRFGSFPPDGLKHVQLWRRKWEGPWTVTIQLGTSGDSISYGDNNSLGAIESEYPSNEELKSRSSREEISVTARCVWSDANRAKAIPALHEVKQYMPQWAVVTKASVGLLEVKKTVKVA